MRKNMICFIIVIAMMISGMYFAEAETHSILSDTDSAENIYSFSSPARIPRSQIYAEECSGLQFAAEAIEESERLREQSGVRVSIIFIALAVLLASFQYFIRIRQLLLYKSIRSRSVIIRYIHHQDGRKG